MSERIRTVHKREPILSELEVDAILESARLAKKHGLQSQAEPIDLLASDRLIQQMIPSLSVGYVRLTESLRKILTSVLRRKVEASHERPEVITGRGLKRISERSACLIALRSIINEKDCGYSILALDPVFTFSVIERLFGGGSGSMPMIPADRSPTALERRMIIRSMQPVIDALNRNLEPSDTFMFTAERIESTLDLVPGITPDITILHIPFTLRLGEHSARISLALPSPVLEPLHALLCTPLNEAQEFAPEMSQIVANTPMTLSVELGTAMVSLRDIINLHEGMVLSLDRHPTSEVPIHIEGITKFYGYPVQDQGALAIEITRKAV